MGPVLGTVDGPKLGTDNVGCMLDIFVGCLVRDSVRIDDGDALGQLEGRIVGCTEGFSDDDDVGIVDGKNAAFSQSTPSHSDGI